jgi:Phosphodiester glycosidase
MGCVRILFCLSAASLAAVLAASLMLRHSGKQGELPWQRPNAQPATGIEYHYFAEGTEAVKFCASDALVIDVDFARSRYRPYVASDSTGRRHGGTLSGKAHTVLDWCMKTGSPAGVNGGYFGATAGEYREIEGLLISGGKSLGAAHWIHPSSGKEAYTRTAFAIDQHGNPAIGWAISSGAGRITLYPSPNEGSKGRGLNPESAVSCGPRLICAGREYVSDKSERLVSARALPRTFLAYDLVHDKPRHFVMGIAMTMTYADAARFLKEYFQRQHHTTCAEAMCLDGGSSSQLVYKDSRKGSGRSENQLIDTRPSLVPVPTAILLKPLHTATFD